MRFADLKLNETLLSAVEAEGYTLLLANSDEDIDREHHAVEAFRTRIADGIIVAPVTGSDSAHLRQRGDPCVAAVYPPSDLPRSPRH